MAKIIWRCPLCGATMEEVCETALVPFNNHPITLNRKCRRCINRQRRNELSMLGVLPPLGSIEEVRSPEYYRDIWGFDYYGLW